MTAIWHSREELVHQIVTLTRDGLSRRAVARAVGVSRNTVKAVLEAHQAGRAMDHIALPSRPTRAPRSSKLDVFKPRVAELLATFEDITAQRVFEILRSEGFVGGYTAVKKHMRRVRPPPKPAPSLPTPVYGPGKMAGSDWSPYTIAFEDGKHATLQALDYVLAWSTRKFVGIYERNDLHALMAGHVCAFERFEGCAEVCRYDGQSPVVSRWEGAQPLYNPRFLAFAAHYEFRPSAVKGNPNANPRAERSFWEVERSFFNGRSFRDLEDLRAQLAHWLDTIVDHRPRHHTTALARFAEEQPHLVPLPRHPYDTARVVYRLCGIDGYVDFEGNRYAVPYDHVTDILPVRATQRELFVYAADLTCVARHELAPRGAGLKLDPAGLHPPPQRKSPIDLDQIRVAFDLMGEQASAFFRLMSLGPPRVWGHQARQILLLRERYSTADLDLALGHAARFGAVDYRAVERIVATRAALRTLDEYVAEDTARRLEETLGKARTKPRDLREYDRLPLASARQCPTTLPTQELPLWPNESAKETATETQAVPPPTPSAPPPPTIASSNDSDDTSSSSD